MSACHFTVALHRSWWLFHWELPEWQESGVWGRERVDLSGAAMLFDCPINVSLLVLMMPIFFNPLIELCKKKPHALQYSIFWSTSGIILKLKHTLGELNWKTSLLQRYTLSVCSRRKGGSLSQYSIIQRHAYLTYPVLSNIRHIRMQINYKAFLRTIAETSSCFSDKILRLFRTFPQTYSN